MADDPRRHVAAVRAAENTEAVGVDEVELFDGFVDDRHQVLVVDAPPARTGVVVCPRAAYGTAPGLAVPRRAAWVGVDDGVARRGLHLELVEETVAVLGERSTVDVEQRRVARSPVGADG